MEEGDEYRQIGPTAEFIMKNEKLQQLEPKLQQPDQRLQQLKECKGNGQICPTAEVIMRHIMASGASATTRFTKMQQLEEGEECRQILPTVEVTQAHFI